jgi:hypothetical protein
MTGKVAAPDTVSIYAYATHSRGVGGIIRSMPDVVHIYGSSYETCPVCGQKCAYGGDTNATANEPVIRPADWEIELYCTEHGFFRVLAGNLIQSA